MFQTERLTQTDWVKLQLHTYGKVTRNSALQMYISRLGAIIHTLKQEGYGFSTKYISSNGGKDFEYRVVKYPY